MAGLQNLALLPSIMENEPDDSQTCVEVLDGY
jgi:hypothetical protein